MQNKILESEVENLMIDKGYTDGYAGLKTGAVPVSALREYEYQLGWRLKELQTRIKT